MGQTLIEKARDQRLKALRRVRQKAFFASVEFVEDISNVFDTAEPAACASNVVAFHHFRAALRPAEAANRHLH